MARRNHRLNPKFPSRSPVTAAVAALVICGFLIAGLLASAGRRPLGPLPVPPAIAKTGFSGPLTLSRVTRSVLGAQAIDPIDFIDEINKERVRADAPPLRLSTTLMRAAKMRADVIMKYQNFSHQDPHDGIELGTVLPKLNYHYVYATENIGMGGVSAPDFVNGFMHSPSHRTNLLDPKLADTGAAIVEGPYQKWYVNVAVQLFAVPGGRDEYLGYTQNDVQTYERSLAAVSVPLHPVVRTVNRLIVRRGYSEDAYKKFGRQKQILETVLSKMKREEPLESADVALILEYNTLL